MRNYEQIQGKKNTYSIKELDEVFSNSQSVSIDELAGEWRIGYLFTKEGTGSMLEFLLKIIPLFRVHSKIFINQNNVKAWGYEIFGRRFYNPISKAILREKEFRNKRSASITYKYLPITDYFRRIDENRIMGIMEVCGKLSLYFYIFRLINKG